MYETGDAAIRDADGRVQIAGRMDDIINIAGHRISTAEIEDCVSAFVITFGGAIYKSEGLELVNQSDRKGSMDSGSPTTL